MKLVLLPGLDGTGELFATFVAAFHDLPVQVVAYPPDREMNYGGHEAWVRERLPAEEFVLLAESFSGPVGVAIAAAAPGNLRGLVFCASFASNPLPVFGPLARLVGAFPAVKIPPALFAPLLYAGHGTPELRRQHAQAMSKVSAATLRARVAAILAADYSALLRRIQVPMMYLLATRDRLVPRSAYLEMQRLRPDIRLEEFDAPHFLLQTRSRASAAAVRAFIGALRGEAPDDPMEAG
jgi:pimeloyl-ACP methyl ester carboxylesterase